MKRSTKIVGVVSAVLGVVAITSSIKDLIEECLDVINDNCKEAYDRGYSHGINGLPYDGENPAAEALRDIAVAETMAKYGDIVRENLQFSPEETNEQTSDDVDYHTDAATPEGYEDCG